jgi:O-acetyl-ADP-ribose deacetylase (regulator of RNase III)
VKNCLERAKNNGFSSIAFPDLGSALGYPPRILADLMFTAVEEFSKGKTNPKLNKVIFSIFKNQVYKVMKMFCVE